MTKPPAAVPAASSRKSSSQSRQSRGSGSAPRSSKSRETGVSGRKRNAKMISTRPTTSPQSPNTPPTSPSPAISPPTAQHSSSAPKSQNSAGIDDDIDFTKTTEKKPERTVSPKPGKTIIDEEEMKDSKKEQRGSAEATVFEPVRAKIRPAHESLPMRKYDTTTEFPKQGTGKAALCFDETPTAMVVLKPDATVQGTIVDETPTARPEVDKTTSTYIPFLPAYKPPF